MEVKFQPKSVIKAHLGINPEGKAQRFFTHTCKLHMDKYTPFREGGLAYINVEEGPNYIQYQSSYANYMYEGKAMGPSFPIFEGDTLVGFRSRKGIRKTYNGKDLHYNQSAGHEYAGPHWDQRMWTAESEDVLDEVAKYMLKENE